MIDPRGRVANLSPEQRALLGSKLAKSVPVNASRASTVGIAIVSVACRRASHCSTRLRTRSTDSSAQRPTASALPWRWSAGG